MNILLERLPTVAEIDGIEYEINTDFRNCLKIILAFEDAELTAYEKNTIMLKLLYKEIPQDVKQAQKIAVMFLNCGEENKASASESGSKVYSFEKDSRYIYTAINQTHRIDLEKIDYLHWWKFCYMFMDLKEDCFFTKLVDLRNRKNKGKLSKEEKEYCYKTKDIIDLPQIQTAGEAEAENEFMRLLGKS